MKPSEKIEEILNTNFGSGITVGAWEYVWAIKKYLDEEYEKKQKLEQFEKDFAVHDAESKLQ